MDGRASEWRLFIPGAEISVDLRREECFWRCNMRTAGSVFEDFDLGDKELT